MEIDLDQLGAMHPRLLHAGEADVYRRRGALALTRAKHSPGVCADVLNGDRSQQATIRWAHLAQADSALEVIDEHRVTEDGAEGLALAFVHTLSGWSASRRVQRDGSADWVLTSPSRHKMALALEVSGTANGGAAQRLRVKREQVARVQEPCVRAAVVVSFAEPQILAATADGGSVP